ncbi:MAG: aldo/keto reductase [Ktedonobacteraceae bacterium]|nr:aldo/keto reductase [Ktedonobacteraceae bacterium]
MRNLGRTDMQVTPLCLGGNVFGWTADEADSFKVLDAYVDGEGNFIDTADVYSTWVVGHDGGESEKVLGDWMHKRGNRAHVIIATKVGSPMPEKGHGLSRRYIMHAVEDSLRRLRTDYIDLYQAHRDDLETPQEETLATFADLIHQGKVRAIGASNFTAQRLESANKISEREGYPRYECLQPAYNLVHRKEYEAELEPLCRKQQIGVISYSSLASGFLTGKYRKGAALPPTPRAQGVQSKYWNDKSFSLLEQLDRAATIHGATPGQVALAWLIARPGITAPIASATSVAQARELMGALKLQLDQETIEALNQASNGL